jgi:hypothetical protein
MKGIPQERYTKELRGEAVKLVTERNMEYVHTGCSPEVVVTAIDLMMELGKSL